MKKETQKRALQEKLFFLSQKVKRSKKTRKREIKENNFIGKKLNIVQYNQIKYKNIN